MIELPRVIGIPPDSHESIALLYNSIPICEITPCSPSFSIGPLLYTIEEDWKTYEDLLSSYGFINQTRPLQVAFILDSTPSFSFNNEYGETFIESGVGVVSPITAEIAQLTGGRTVGQAVRRIAERMAAAPGMVGTVGQGIQTGLNELENLRLAMAASGGRIGSLLSKTVDLLSALGAGARIDFPMIWKSSSFSPSIAITVRLYNPIPSNINYTNKYIVGPLASLLLLACPIAIDSKYAFQWPFFHKIKCKGLFKINHGFISNVTVSIGEGVSYNQVPSLIDVRLEFGNVFNNMIATKGDDETPENIKSFLRAFTDSKELREEIVIASPSDEKLIEEKKIEELQTPKNISQTVTDVTLYPSPRVSSDLKNKMNILRW